MSPAPWPAPAESPHSSIVTACCRWRCRGFRRHIKDQLPDSFVTADDAIGILIGAPAPDFATQIDDMPLSPVRIVPIVLLTAAELGEIRAGDEETRNAIADRLAAMPNGHRSDIGRLSIV
jgi:hypothetical protein